MLHSLFRHLRSSEQQILCDTAVGVVNRRFHSLTGCERKGDFATSMAVCRGRTHARNWAAFPAANRTRSVTESRDCAALPKTDANRVHSRPRHSGRRWSSGQQYAPRPPQASPVGLLSYHRDSSDRAILPMAKVEHHFVSLHNEVWKVCDLSWSRKCQRLQ